MPRHQMNHRRRSTSPKEPALGRLGASLRARAAAVAAWARRLEHSDANLQGNAARTGFRPRSFYVAVGLLAALFVWSYWPVLVDLWQTWGREADYSHGYLVVPVAIGMLWLRRGSCPTPNGWLSLGGLALLGVGAAVRLAGAIWYIKALQGWSILFWLAGTVWLLGGFAMLRFSAPAIGFLAFMIPLPFRAEGILSLPLQRVATQFSCWMLQCLDQPAIAEGNVVLINETRLMVAEACSGLRIFMSILALAYAYCALIDKPWWTKLSLAVSVLPIALLTNSIRIVATGLTHEYLSGHAANVFAHDLAGWLMLPLAALLMYILVRYSTQLVVQVETVSARELLHPDVAR